MLTDFDETLYINQILITIQGEGKFLGVPCLLMRFSCCNLKCDFCDTKYSWKKSEAYMKINNKNFTNYKIKLKKIVEEKKIKHLLITGGEPLLYAFNPLFPKLINEINNWNNVEIETNGTLLNKTVLHSLFKIDSDLSINISPKLDSTCYKDKKLYNFNSEILDCFQRYFDVNYKFVHDVGSEKKILSFIKNYNLKRQNVCAMALTPDFNKFKTTNSFFEEFNLRNQKTLQFCINNAIRFSPRIHYSLFGKNKQEFESINM